MNALEAGMDVPASTAAAGYNLSYNRLIKNLPKEKTMKALGFTAAETTEIKNITEALLRAGDRSGYNFSGTAFSNEAIGIAGAIGQLMTGSLKGGATLLGKFIGIKHIADAMTSPEGRRSLKIISSSAQKPASAAAKVDSASRARLKKAVEFIANTGAAAPLIIPITQDQSQPTR